jgi:hypothetical protein
VLNSNANVTEANGVIPSQDLELAIPTVAAAAGDKGNFCCKNAVAGVYHNLVVL